MTHHDYFEIYRRALANADQEITVELAEGDTADVPGTTKKVAIGPGEVTYVAHRDGGMDVRAITASVVPRR